MAIVVIDDQVKTEHMAAADEIRQKLGAGEFIWVDVVEPDRNDHELLCSTFGIDEEDTDEALRMRQRPRIADLDDNLAMLVLYGVSEQRRTPVELHMLVSERFVVTIHDAAISSLAACQSRHRLHENDKPVASLVVVHKVLDAVADGYFPRLSKLDDEIDRVEDAIFKSPTDEQLQQLFAMKRELIAMRKVITPMRDMLGAVFTGVVELPGFTADTSGWLRDAYDHMIRISDLVDSYRDLLTGAMDVYLSTVSNRLNSVMKQLTVIATIFLPLTFVTGFFGQNFSLLVRWIGGTWTFWVFAIGVEVSIVIAMMWLFRRRKWI
ncbi:MAG: magnesium/cobalt transporter CorA [Acidimicrobiales bacterium]